MANIYDEMQHQLDGLKFEKNRSKWVADFNAMAREIEEEIKHDLTGAEDQVSLPPWEAKLESDGIWLYTPPLIKKGRGNTFDAVRLALNADKPVTGQHVNARSVPSDETFKITGRKQFACIIVNTNAEQIKEHPLVAVWFLWDSIARIGIVKALENGLITSTWIDNAFAHVTDPCEGRYPLAYYRHGNGANEYLITLYRLCAARGITQEMLHGEGSRGSREGRRWISDVYRNTWIDENGVCECCDFTKEHPLSYGTKNYPYGSILGHVNSIRHCKNAAEYLLKMEQGKSIKAVKSVRAKKEKK